MRPTLGTRIAQARLDAGSNRGTAFTQTELAKLVGVTPPTVSQWEADESIPPLATIQAIADALRTEPGPLAFGDKANVVAAAKLPKPGGLTVHKDETQNAARGRRRGGGES